jgi:hypothetical protein
MGGVTDWAEDLYNEAEDAVSSSWDSIEAEANRVNWDEVGQVAVDATTFGMTALNREVIPEEWQPYIYGTAGAVVGTIAGGPQGAVTGWQAGQQLEMMEDEMLGIGKKGQMGSEKIQQREQDAVAAANRRHQEMRQGEQRRATQLAYRQAKRQRGSSGRGFGRTGTILTSGNAIGSGSGKSLIGA